MAGTERGTGTSSPVPSCRQGPRNRHHPQRCRCAFPCWSSLRPPPEGRVVRDEKGYRVEGAGWDGCHLIGTGPDRPAILRVRQEAGRIAAGIDCTKWQDAEGRGRYGCGVGDEGGFRAGCGGPGPTGARVGSWTMTSFLRGEDGDSAVPAAGFSHGRGGSRALIMSGIGTKLPVATAKDARRTRFARNLRYPIGWEGRQSRSRRVFRRILGWDSVRAR